MHDRANSRENGRKVQSPDFEFVSNATYSEDYRRRDEAPHHSRHRSRSPGHSRVFQESRSKSREYSKYSREYRERFEASELSRSSDLSTFSRSPTHFTSHREHLRPMTMSRSPERRRTQERSQSHRRDRIELEIEHDDAAFSGDYEKPRNMPPRRMSMHQTKHLDSKRDSSSLNYYPSGFSSIPYQPEAQTFQNEFHKFPSPRLTEREKRVETDRPTPQRRKSTYIENSEKDGSIHPRFEEARKKLLGNVKSQSSEVEVSTTVMKIKEFAEKVLPNEEKTENLVKNLEEVLGREAFLKIKSLLAGGDGDKQESLLIPKVATKLEITSETKTQNKISKAEKFISKSYEKLENLQEKQMIEVVQPSASSKSSHNSLSSDESSNDSNQQETASVSIKSYTIPKKSKAQSPLVVKSLEMTEAKKQGSIIKSSKDQKSTVDSKLLEMQTKRADKKSSKVNHRSSSKNKCSQISSFIEKSSIRPAASTIKSESKPTVTSKLSKPKSSLTPKSSFTSKSPVTTKSSVDVATSKPIIPLQPKKKLTELDRLLLDIDGSFMRDEINAGFQKRHCTVVTYKEDLLVKYQEYDLKKLSLKIVKLDLSNEDMPVKLDREFLKRHPSLESTMSFRDVEQVEKEVQDYNTEIQTSETEEKKKQESPKKIETPKSKKKSALTRKRAAWSRGVIKKKTKRPKMDFADDEWEDIEDDELDGETMKISDFIGAVDLLLPQPKSTTIMETSDIVQDFSFTVCRAGKLKKCRICNFESVDNENFLTHIQNAHKVLKWNKYCKKCDALVENACESLEDEFLHLLKHLGEEPKLSLKIRSLPGDTLSTVSKAVINLPDPRATKRLEVLTGTATMIHRHAVNQPGSEGNESKLQIISASSLATIEENVVNEAPEEEKLLMEVEESRSSSEDSSISSSKPGENSSSYGAIEKKTTKRSVEQLKERLKFLTQKLSVQPSKTVKLSKKVESRSSDKPHRVQPDTQSDAVESQKSKANPVQIAPLTKPALQVVPTANAMLVKPMRLCPLKTRNIIVKVMQPATKPASTQQTDHSDLSNASKFTALKPITAVQNQGTPSCSKNQFTPLKSPNFCQVKPANTSGFKLFTPVYSPKINQITPSGSSSEQVTPSTSSYKQVTPSTSSYKQITPSTSSYKQATPSSIFKQTTPSILFSELATPLTDSLGYKSKLLKTNEHQNLYPARIGTDRFRRILSKETSAENVFQLQSKPKKVPVVIKIPRYAFHTQQVMGKQVKMSVTGSSVLYEKEIELVSISTLRPWLVNTEMKKSCNLCAEMLSTECLAALFKCMGTNCSFYTSDESVFTMHLDLHEHHESHDVKSFLACAYCNIVTGNSAALIAHVVDFHGDNNFQCSYCFFRSFNDFHVFFHHRNSCHKSKPRKIIEIIQTAPKVTRCEAMNRIRNRLHLTVPPIVCSCKLIDIFQS